ncbi:hypothetical protein QEH48_gp111 [Streptomyces phage TurkishDelight]|uniref:Uncharacterized protein n=1 Tax=Streptomyces phage TurkishDelight TaxID=2793708 RepID=A0A7T0M1A8_9CAUD|nr:hypothetical protein QEH48_gp111 [Streptomyces phage TurkishDelight]QPL14140.1 hypothetical protein SEA_TURKISHDELIGHT_111 [Streptomyces phage TurkishDelight]
MSSSAPRATALTPEELDELRARAAREAGPFVDPRVQAAFRVHGPEWAADILGRPYGGPYALTWPELYLLHLAVQAEPTPPPPPRATAARELEEEAARRAAAEEAARSEEEWRELADALQAAGVRVEVRHNYTSARHLEFYTQGADHVYLLDPLHVGRLHRASGVALCHTPSNARNLAYLEPTTDGRLPSCQTCLRHMRAAARRLAA